MTAVSADSILATINLMAPTRERIAPRKRKHEALSRTLTAHLTSHFALTRDSKKAEQDAEKAHAAAIEYVCAEAIGDNVGPPPEPMAVKALEERQAGLAAAANLTLEKAAGVKGEIELVTSDIFREARSGLEKFSEQSRQKTMAYLDAFLASARDTMAADYLINTRFEDPKAPSKWYQGPEALFGPAGVMLERIRTLDWDTWPYSLRPTWAHKNSAPVWKHSDIATTQVALLHSLGLEKFR